MSSIHDDKIKKIEEKANEIRQDLIKSLLEAKSGHSAGPLGFIDVLSTLYFHVLKYDPKNPNWEDRDKLFVSHGHIAPAIYAVMAHAGYFPVEELMTLRKLGSRLQGHPHRESLPGLESSSGPLGQGLSQAIGAALAAKLDGKRNRIYACLSDGEHDEGQTWEAALFAAKYKLNNLTAILDRNNIQIDGYTEDVMPLDSLALKYESFGWHVLEVDGHNIGDIADACEFAKSVYEKPVMIIAHTIPGKGVDFMEFKFEWHGKPPNKEEAKASLDQLRTLGGKIKSEHE
ncbi:transketolase [Candidatus Azambacteria bacterium]|nr:transketolase [Candidatus Azambacteria bacterium]